MATKPTKKTTSSATTETKLVRELAKILNDTELSEIAMTKGDLKIRVSKHAAGGTVMQAVAAPTPVAAPAASAPAVESPAPTSKADAGAHPGAVKSPMVGTAYVRPSPDADAFVKAGDKVKEGDTILLVEAMKTFNPITAPKSGKIEEILVDDAQPVEFGETLFIIV
ncbi:acetyl-CoA carboxylase biotin carboxyl carrier protein [Fretibacter rubidus]|uniref:acetyl-CoA carboxylase biotin carboxyl carrier protein n=1 Tax=Fretibacter rubidus TaxID=570162 RepID=UPI00352BA194